MSELRDPGYVRFDLRVFFDKPHQPDTPRIGIVTNIAYDNYDGGVLLVRGGVADSGIHSDLAEKAEPGSGKIIQLPPEMYSRHGVVTSWFYPEIEDQPLVIAGQVDGERNPDASLTYEQTDRHLRLAGLALGTILSYPPSQVASFRDPNGIIISKPVLRKAERRFRRYIYSG